MDNEVNFIIAQVVPFNLIGSTLHLMGEANLGVMQFLIRASFEMTMEVIPKAHEESHPDFQLFIYFLVLLIAVLRFLSRSSFEMTVEVIPIP